MVLLPLAEIVARGVFHTGVRGSTPLVQHLTLWVAFLGSALAARENRLLSFGTKELLQRTRWSRPVQIAASTYSALISGLLFRAGIEFFLLEKDAGTMVTIGVPVWVAQLVIPVAFLLIGLRLAWFADPGKVGKLIALAGLIGGMVLSQYYEVLDGAPGWPVALAVLLATMAGSPIFAILGGMGALFFMLEGVQPAAVLAEAYRMSVSPTLPAIPLFTLVGFFLAESGASTRLLRFFRAFVGWFPGGTAVVTTVLCAFFTVVTGGSGVTILALGGLLLPALLKDGYRERFSVGLLTGAGSLGLLFPPALPLILYGIVAQISIQELFIAGLVPGIVLVVLVAAWGVREGIRAKVPRQRFKPAEARAAAWEAKWELLLPVVALGAIFSGYATLVEAATVTVAYAFVVTVFIHRDVSLTRDVPRILVQCLAVIGGVLLILASAMGFSSWLVDAEIPSMLLDWVMENIHSPWVFLLVLNLFLLAVGAFLDIFSATVVTVPLIVPMAEAFGINPIHLGIIFVANLELGYLTPPVGLNLFFASYRFDKPLLSVYRSTLPILLILGVGVLIITYAPPLFALLRGTAAP